MQAALLIMLLPGCKKTVDPITADTPPTLVGNWKVTALTFTPAWTSGTGASVPDYIPYLKAKGETCLTDMTVSFTAAGAYSANSGSTPSCGNARDSKVILDFLFGDEATFTETETQAVLYGKGKVTSLPLRKSGTNQLLTIQFDDDEDLSARKIRTTYSITMARQ